MKTWIRLELSVLLIAGIFAIVSACKETITENGTTIEKSDTPSENLAKKKLSEDFKKYWYAGEAEITSYRLEQARYGEMREGTAVLIYVTEPFLPQKQVKADGNEKSNIPVLKLNSTKNYLTGIYPYSIMTSSFYPVHNNQHALKVSFSAQEWCGHVYAQLNSRDAFEVTSHSYFESEADQEIILEKTILENELWNKLRIDPASLPVGQLEIIPSLEYIRLSHKELKAFAAEATLTKNDTLNSYEIKYPLLERTLTINFTPTFPYSIESWSESSKSGFGENARIMTSTATKLKAFKSPYWQQNGNNHLSLRDSLGL
ncbi:MAG: septum formation inhibitor Maf [Flavobacteriaceae bacterium]